MKKENKVVTGSKVAYIGSGIGFILSTIGLVLLLVSGKPFLPDFSMSSLIAHPLVWMFITGISFFQLLIEEKKK